MIRMRLIEHSSDRYLRAPRLVRAESGQLEVWCIATTPTVEALIAFGESDEPRVVRESPAIVALTRGDGAPAVTDDASAWDSDSSWPWTVRVEHEDGWSTVFANEVMVWRAWGTAAAPTVLSMDGGAWVAFHHNVREDTGEPDLVKWIAVRFVTEDGHVLEPAAPMRERDRDREGEEQGFEFPTLVAVEGGGLTLFGRGSHAFFRQDLSAQGWSERRALGSTEWGCRGRWVAACADGDRILTARREKRGIEVERVEPPPASAPALTAARVELERRPHRDVPPRPRGADPAARDGRRTLFGDIHQHSAHSDGCGVADEPYLRARYVYGDDFCALTDHESFIGKRIGEGEWSYLCAVADRHDDPGSFATLIAYEWTGQRYPGPGHKVVYLPSEGGAIVSRDDVPDGAELVARVKALGGFAVPHHVGWTGANEEAHDAEGQPVWEICSCHGCYLTADHPLGGRGDLRDQMVDAVMKRGKRFGFIACSDGHGLLFHHGVGRKRDSFRCGLTAVQAEDCTREAILRAVRERRCYATSGVPIFLDLRAAGASMGSVLTIDAPVVVRAEASSATPIRSLALIGPEGVVAEVGGDGRTEAIVEWSVGAGWVYARVEQEDGEMAWSSPIFLDV